MRGALAPVLAAAALLAAACTGATDAGTGDSFLVAGFQSTPLAFSNVTSTFSAAESSDSAPWCPPGRPGHERGPDGAMRFGGPGPMGFMMGGGLDGAFLGLGFGPGFGHRPPGEGDPFASCSFNPASGRVECAAENRNGLTIQRSAQFLDAAGGVLQAFDSSNTNTVNTRIGVNGTITRRDGAVSSVQHHSDRTVSGLAPSSTQRIVNGTSSGEETTTGSDSTGSFTAVRMAGDTVQAVVIPLTLGHPSYPVSGTITRSMSITVTYQGAAPTTSTRREVIVYDGSDTAKITITHDGETRNCTLPLPRGRISCS